MGGQGFEELWARQATAPRWLLGLYVGALVTGAGLLAALLLGWVRL